MATLTASPVPAAGLGPWSYCKGRPWLQPDGALEFKSRVFPLHTAVVEAKSGVLASLISNARRHASGAGSGVPVARLDLLQIQALESLAGTVTPLSFERFLSALYGAELLERSCSEVRWRRRNLRGVLRAPPGGILVPPPIPPPLLPHPPPRQPVCPGGGTDNP